MGPGRQLVERKAVISVGKVALTAQRLPIAGAFAPKTEWPQPAAEQS